MWGQALLAVVYLSTVTTLIKAFLWQRAQADEAKTVAKVAEQAAKRLELEHTRELRVRDEGIASVRREYQAEVEDLRREVFKLQTVAEAKRRYDICHRCDQPKGQPQHGQQTGNGQRVRGNARVHAIVNGEE